MPKALCISLLIGVIVISIFSVRAQHFIPVTKTPEGKATVYIYRPSKAYGMAAGYYLIINDQLTDQKLWNKSYMVRFVNPGPCTVSSKNKKLSVTFPVKEGEIYYVEGSMTYLEIPEPSVVSDRISKCKLTGVEKTKDKNHSKQNLYVTLVILGIICTVVIAVL